jgi:hypothetical protein
MAYKIHIDPSARLDIFEAIDWYNGRQQNLGFRFYENTKASFSKIQKNPFGYAIRYKNIRTAIIGIFPYMIHYLVDQDSETIRVLAIISTYRNPESSWFENKKER